MDKNIIGMDLDGVIAFATRKYTEGGIYKKYKTCILQMNTPTPETIIITGRKIRFKKLTKLWLKKYKVKYSKIIFNDGKSGDKKTFKNLADFKSRMIIKQKVTIYIEDTPEIAIRIQDKVPGCKVMLLFNTKLYTLNKVSGNDE